MSHCFYEKPGIKYSVYGVFPGPVKQPFSILPKKIFLIPG
jgi:hypothetical protein